MSESDEDNLNETKFNHIYRMVRNANGTFNRDLAEKLECKVPASGVPVDGVFSADCVDENTGCSNRVYREAPENNDESCIIEKPLGTTQKVPIIIYYHGGSFCHSSPSTAIYDTLCRRLVSICKAVVVSVDYRRSPEHRYPCAYEDGFFALKWVKSRAWLQSGHDSKVHVYLAGDSSGGNIAHHVAVMAAKQDIGVQGNILLQPLFGGEKRTQSEKKLDGKYSVTLGDRDWCWKAFLPEGEDRDHHACNPFGPKGESLEGLKFPKGLVFVPGFDIIQDWQMEYVKSLEKFGHNVKLLFLEKTSIGFFFFSSNDRYHCLMEEIKKFVA